MSTAVITVVSVVDYKPVNDANQWLKILLIRIKIVNSKSSNSTYNDIISKINLDALATVRYPGTGKNLVEAEMGLPDNMRIDGMKVSFSLTFEKPTDPFMKSMVKAAETAIHTYVSPEVEVVITTESRQAARPEVGKHYPR